MSEHPHKYDGIPEQFIPTLERYEVEYFRENKPVPFCGMQIHPIQTRNYEKFLNSLSCLLLNRKSSAEGLGKTDLGWLIAQTKLPDQNPKKPADPEWVSGRMWLLRLYTLTELVFGIKNGLKCKHEGCGHVITYDSPEWSNMVKDAQTALQNGSSAVLFKCPECGTSDTKGSSNFTEEIKVVEGQSKGEERLYVDGHEITPDDFQLFRYIVPFQNMPDYRSDSQVAPELKADFEKRAQMLSKKNGNLVATLERKVIAVSIMTGFEYEKLYDLPMRTFNQMFSMIRGRDDYRLAKLLTSIFPPEKDKPAPDIGDWVYEKDEDMYAGVYHDLDEQKKGLGVK